MGKIKKIKEKTSVLENTEKEIKITKTDFLPTFNGVKSILKKFNKATYFDNKVKNIIIDLDFDKNESSHLNLALIWRLMNNLFEKKKFSIIVRYKGSDKSFLNDRHFFDRFRGSRSIGWNSSIPIHFETFNPSGKDENVRVEKIFNDMIKTFLEPKNEFHKEIKIHMLEIITNAFDHSKTIKDASSICSLDNSKDILDFCVIDTGQGIKRSFLDNPKLEKKYITLSDENVIKKATEFRISCNPVNARNPKYPYSNGGIGLFFLKEFVRMHKNCHLIIISNKGFYYLDNKKEVLKNLNNIEWKGTVVNFRLFVNQKRNQEYEELIKSFIESLDERTINVV